MPFSSLVTGQPDLWQAGVYYLLLAAAVIGKRRGARIFFVAGIMAAVLTLGWRPGPQFRLTMLDVGQGDCLALETVSGNCYLIDGGSSSVQQVGAYRILPYIKQRGRSIIEGVFVTHPDQCRLPSETAIRAIFAGQLRTYSPVSRYYSTVFLT